MRISRPPDGTADRRRRRRPVPPTAVAVLSWLLLATGAAPTGAALARTAGHGQRQPGRAHVSHRTPEVSRVGPLFRGPLRDGHFCTASVVHSPGRSLVVTAAHCLDEGTGSLTFAPGYRDGRTPYGAWRLTAAFVDRRWADDSDEDLDVAFAVVAPLDGRLVEDVVGGNRLGLDPGDGRRVRLTGYPDTEDEPLSCANTASRFSETQLRIECTDYSQGTSGSPWVTAVDPATGTGTVIGVIGGHEQGGDTDSVSYSPYFDHDVEALYDRAVASGG